MVTAASAYGSNTTILQYRAVEPPAVIEFRSTYESVLTEVYKEFVNQSVQATALGIKALDAGNYITLDDLEELVRKQ